MSKLNELLEVYETTGNAYSEAKEKLFSLFDEGFDIIVNPDHFIIDFEIIRDDSIIFTYDENYGDENTIILPKFIFESDDIKKAAIEYKNNNLIKEKERYIVEKERSIQSSLEVLKREKEELEKLKGNLCY